MRSVLLRLWSEADLSFRCKPESTRQTTLSRRRDIDQFVESLSRAETPDDRSINIYRDAIRCRNLTRWLKTIEDSPRSAIFVGEAPGRDGGAITGIPFVSPMILTSANDPWGEFGQGCVYEIPVGAVETQRERTATRFWRHVPQHFDGLPRPLTWNVYPFWPFEFNARGNMMNRSPTREEITHGTRWLRRLRAMYPRALTVAVGIKADETLKKMGVDAPMIPHPSRGSDAKLIGSIAKVAGILRV